MAFWAPSKEQLNIVQLHGPESYGLSNFFIQHLRHVIFLVTED